MDSGKLNDWVQVVGIFAVVASLIFVGLQMRQSQEIAIADQYQDRADSALNYYLAQFQSDQMIANRARGFSAAAEAGRLPERVASEIESEGVDHVVLSYLRFKALMIMYDNYHFQYENGFLSAAAWGAFRGRLKFTLDDELREAFYRWTSADHRPTFQMELKRTLEELDYDRVSSEFRQHQEEDSAN